MEGKGKESILNKMRSQNSVAFPEKSHMSNADLLNLSRIEQLKVNAQTFKQQEKEKENPKKKVMFA